MLLHETIYFVVKGKTSCKKRIPTFTLKSSFKLLSSLAGTTSQLDWCLQCTYHTVFACFHLLYKEEQNQKKNRTNWVWFILWIIGDMNPRVSKEVYHLKPAFGSWECTVTWLIPLILHLFALKGKVAKKNSEKVERAQLHFQ